jgi:hypothetical protein
MRTKPALLMVPVIAAALALGACGDDDDTEAAATTEAPAASDSTSAAATTTATSEDLDKYCSTAVALEAAAAEGGGEEDPEANKAFAATLLPFLHDMEASAPASMKPMVSGLIPAAEAAAETGDVSAFETPEFTADLNELHAAGVESCEWATTDVELNEYHFMGVPATLPQGVMSFELSNTGKEPHVMDIVRKNDGVTESFEEILALPEEEAFAKVTTVGGGFVAPGETSYALVDFAPGEYLALCPLPVGWVDMSGPPPDGAPHFTEGMLHEFTVE